MRCDVKTDGEGSKGVSTTDSRGVDTDKLCPHANPLVHYSGLRKRTPLGRILILLGMGLLVLFFLAMGALPSIGSVIGANVGTLRSIQGIAWLFVSEPQLHLPLGSLLIAAMICVLFRLLLTDPRRDGMITDVVLTTLTPREIFFGSLQSSVSATTGLAIVLTAMMLGFMTVNMPTLRSWWQSGSTSFAGYIPAMGILILASLYVNVRGWCMGGVGGTLQSLAQVLSIWILLAFAYTVILTPQMTQVFGMQWQYMEIPSRTILLSLGFVGLLFLARRGVHSELIPLFFRSAHPEQAGRYYWLARELAARDAMADMAEGRRRLTRILGADRIADFFVALASQLLATVVLQAVYHDQNLEEFFRGSYVLMFSGVFSAICVVLRRMYIPPRPGLPVVSGALRQSIRRWYFPILLAQLFGAGLPLLFASGLRVWWLDYYMAVFSGIVLGNLAFVALIPQTGRVQVAKVSLWILLAICILSLPLDGLNKWNTERFLREISPGWAGGMSVWDAEFHVMFGHLTRAIAFFVYLAMMLGLRGILLQRIHESEVLDHPIGALSTDPVADAIRPPA